MSDAATIAAETVDRRRKLSDAQVQAIVREVATPCGGCGRLPRFKDIGERHGVCIATVHKIATGKSHGLVPDPEEVAR